MLWLGLLLEISYAGKNRHLPPPTCPTPPPPPTGITLKLWQINSVLGILALVSSLKIMTWVGRSPALRRFKLNKNAGWNSPVSRASDYLKRLKWLDANKNHQLCPECVCFRARKSPRERTGQRQEKRNAVALLGVKVQSLSDKWFCFVSVLLGPS